MYICICTSMHYKQFIYLVHACDICAYCLYLGFKNKSESTAVFLVSQMSH